MRRYEYDDEIEERRFSWTDLFIKVIIVLIFILFTIWLISLPNRKRVNTTTVASTSAFSENINKMKDAGQSYFTAERLPEKVGEVKTITLERMYKNKMLLTLTDQNGKACSAKDSYVSMEKKDNEYQMKTFLKCGKESDYVITTMGCYDYCPSNVDICEKKYGIDAGIDIDDNGKKIIEPKDSEGSKGTIGQNIEYQYSKSTGGAWSAWSNFSKWLTTKVVKNDSTDVETKVVNENTGSIAYKIMGTPTCPSVSNYTLSSRNNDTCSYRLANSTTSNPVCPSVSGYNLTSRNGFTCNYSKSSSSTANPTCPSVSGYSLTSRNGFTCNYSKSAKSSDYTLSYYGSGSGSYMPADTSTYHYVQKSADYIYKCDGTCGMRWYYTYAIYKKNYKTVTYTTTKTATCPSGYSKSGSTCAKSVTSTITKFAICPTGYDKSGNTCAKGQTSTITKKAICPSGQIVENGKCYKIVNTVKSNDVTYYRYRTRKYLNGTTDYKWSSSNNDNNLLNDGYKLTGVTRNGKEEK